METKQRKGKDWADLILAKDPDEYENISVTKTFPITQTIHAKDLKTPIFRDRFNHEVVDDEVEHISQIPLTVVKSHESDQYIVVEGVRYFIEGKKQGINKFQCNVIDEVYLDVQAYIPRLVHVFKDNKPFHILEQAGTIDEIKRLVITNYGEDNIFGQGGDRKSANYKKITLVTALEQKLPFKKYKIDTLKRFNENVGPVGLEHLYKILRANHENLSIYRIRRLNPKMRKMGFRNKIDIMVDHLTKEGKSWDKIQGSVALMVYDVLFEKTRKPKDEGAAPPEEGDIENDKNPAPPAEPELDPEVSLPPKYYPISSKDLSIIKKAFKLVFLAVADVGSFLQQKRSLNEKEAEELYRMIFDDVQTAFTEFAGLVLKAVNGR